MSLSDKTSFVQIIQAYGKILETTVSIPGTVVDSNKLPYPKQMIKDAIVLALRSTNDLKTKESLKFGYIQLSHWQQGVGDARQDLDVSALDIERDPKSVAKAIAEGLRGSEKWKTIAKEERDALKQELQDLGLW